MINRNWTELIQELRSTQTGVQVLTGFLLTVPFSDRFATLDDVQRTAYLIVLSGAVTATAAILSPVAYHRILFDAADGRGSLRRPIASREPGWCWWP